MKFTYRTGARPLDGYTIKRGVGIGGFGEVYYAISDAGKEVALKLIQRNLEVELRGVGHCLNLKHVNLVNLHDIRYDEAGRGWVVMEYINGESLKAVVDRNPNGLPLETVSHWLRGIAAGVACLHEAGIVHRDLKPGNIFDDNGVIKIGDYGLSKFISVSRRSDQTESVGTFHYMAPEIGRGRYGREIDVYALGIIVYEMLTGDVPFDGETSQEIIMKHLTDQPNLTGLPEPYRTAIARALEKDPEKRLGNVGEMMALLNLAEPGSVPQPLPVDAEVIHEPPRQDDMLVINDDDDEVYIGEPDAEVEMNFGPVQQRSVANPATTSLNTKVNEEPIAKVVAGGWKSVTGWFSNPSVSTPLKIVVLLVGVFLMLLNAKWMLPVAIALAVIYGAYYAVRTIVAAGQTDESKSGGPPGSTAAADRRGRSSWNDRVRQQIAARPLPDRMTELTGSLLTSAVASAVLCVVIMIVAGQSLDGSVYRWGSLYAWLTVTSIACSWAVLIAGKSWENGSGDQVIRRFTMLAVGLALGALAWGVDSALLVDLNYGKMLDANRVIPVFDSLHTADGSPTLPAYLAFFAGLFVILRWWLQADPLRRSRLSLFGTGLCALWGFILPFPQPWGFLLAAAVAVAVQLSAPWVSQGERTQLRQRLRLQDAQA